jgi:hypothetical protein
MMDGGMDEWIDGWRNVGTERWIDGWMDGIHYII